ncbi:hypothetical protein [Streptomyces sp. NRRL F-5650]|uniref:hypothetical protein n=1 Tax=Streptomyces sp. NRRL F-5650 TaxID=1463868 RepID=UPI0004C9D723|nr:hypothetical protein [Streptomyces sp. NRRL F-5650]
MRIRRFLTVATAAAVTAPVALLVAPAAHATDDSPSPTVSETAPSQEESTPAADGSSPAADDTTPATEESTPAADESTPATNDPAAPGTSPSATVSASPSASASAPASGPAECGEEDATFDDDLRTGLSGLPSKIVAGSGFHNFKLTVDNRGGRAYHRVDLGVFAAQINEDDFFVDTGHLTLQYKDPATGTWTGISLAQGDEGAGYLGYTDVRAKESFSVDLRLAVDEKAPSGLGFAISIGVYADDEGNCVFSGDDGYYEFDILAAGTTPAGGGDAKPQGGSKPLPVKPVGDTRIDPQGRLAATGSSSALPTIALAGGAAVALGVGTMFVVRRRRTTGSGSGATA